MAPWLTSSLLIAACAALQGPARSPVGKQIDDFTLRDWQGAKHSLGDFTARKLVVVAFIGADCPLAKRYAPRLAELARKYDSQGVAFLAIDSNQQDSLARLGQLAKTHGMTFPVLKDPGNAAADQFGAQRTPEIFVVDSSRRIRYWGRIDDQYGVGYSRSAPRRADLAIALDELLAGKTVSQPVTKVTGCHIGRVLRETARGDVTYSKDIARVLQHRCMVCHREGAIAPFPLISYKDAAAWAETISDVIHDDRMPPWDASARYGAFANDMRLSDAEKRLIDQWVDNGTPEGDPKDVPTPPTFAEGWRIPNPDLVVTMPKPFTVPASGTVPYQYFTVDPGFTEDKWIQASEARAGNPAVVHHMVVIVQRPGEPSPADRGGIGDNVAVGVPGMTPLAYPKGAARFVPAGSKLVFQMHYTPNGAAQTDQSRVGLVFADPKTVRREVRSDMAINVKFRIPAGNRDYPVSADYRFEQDTLIYALFPHMHLRGKAFRFEAFYPDGRHEVLLDVPRYRFDWQNQYVLAEPKRMPEGTRLRCEGHFDNSEENPSNPNPSVAVRFGEQTWQEMLVGYFDMALAYQDLLQGPPRQRPLPDGRSEITFRFQAPRGTKAVYLAADFNGWKPNGHKMDGPDADGWFTTRMTLKPGQYEYKFVIEGTRWRQDPGNPRQIGFYRNSVLTVPTLARK